MCKAFTNGFTEITSDAYVYIKRKPVIRRQPVHFGILGDNIRLDCIVYSIPKPEKITWSFNGRVLGLESMEEYSVS